MNDEKNRKRPLQERLLDLLLAAGIPLLCSGGFFAYMSVQQADRDVERAVNSAHISIVATYLSIGLFVIALTRRIGLLSARIRKLERNE